MQRTLPTLLLIFLLCTCASAQKKAITVEDMQQWNQISNEQISPDGTHVFYTLKKDLGDPTAVIYDVKAKTERRFPRLHRAKLSYDGKYLIGLLKPGMAEVKALKLKEKKEAKDKLKTMDTLLVWNLTDAEPQLTPANAGATVTPTPPPPPFPTAYKKGWTRTSTGCSSATSITRTAPTLKV
jgi:hypothetical protein